MNRKLKKKDKKNPRGTKKFKSKKKKIEKPKGDLQQR